MVEHTKFTGGTPLNGEQLVKVLYEKFVMDSASNHIISGIMHALIMEQIIRLLISDQAC